MLRLKVFKTTSVTHKLGFRFPVIIMIKHLKNFHHTVYGNWHGLIQMLETQWTKAAGVFSPLKSGLSQFAVF